MRRSRVRLLVAAPQCGVGDGNSMCFGGLSRQEHRAEIRICQAGTVEGLVAIEKLGKIGAF